MNTINCRKCGYNKELYQKTNNKHIDIVGEIFLCKTCMKTDITVFSDWSKVQ